MREVKFRAWDEDNSKWFEPDLLAVTNDGLYIFTGWQELPDRLPPMTYTLMQYTGRKDKNGCEIYEGDVLYCDKYVEGYRHQVVDDFDQFIYDDIECMLVASEAEVVGNIYENPELLEAK